MHDFDSGGHAVIAKDTMGRFDRNEMVDEQRGSNDKTLTSYDV
jgi:hypothetical protein